MEPPRPFEQRRSDTLAALAADEADAWVATASPAGTAHLVPLSIGWTGNRIVLVTEDRSVTASNLRSGGHARLAVGPTRDVVMIDVDLDSEAPVLSAPDDLVERFVDQAGWDPRRDADADAYVLFAVRPSRIQAWRESNEISGRTLMRDGEWLTG